MFVLDLDLPEIDKRSDLELDQLFGENLMPEPSDKYKALEPLFPHHGERVEEKRDDTPYPMGKVHSNASGWL